MIAEKGVKALFQGRRQQLAELEANAERAVQLELEVASLRHDVAQAEASRDAFAALGDGHVEITADHFVEEYRRVVKLAVARSVETGAELAARTQGEVDELNRLIAEREAQIAELVRSEKVRV